MQTTEQAAQHAIEQTAISLGQKTTIFGFLASIFGNWTIGDVAAVGGLCLAAAGFAVTLFFGIRRDRREARDDARKAELHEIQKRGLLNDRRTGLPDDRDHPIERRRGAV